MDKLQIYYYWPDYTYMRTGFADPDPMEPGNFLIPGNATAIRPPSPIQRFTGTEWITEEIPVL